MIDVIISPLEQSIQESPTFQIWLETQKNLHDTFLWLYQWSIILKQADWYKSFQLPSWYAFAGQRNIVWNFMICDVKDSNNTVQKLILNKSWTIVGGGKWVICVAAKWVICVAAKWVWNTQQDSTIFLLQKNTTDWTYLSMLFQDEKIIWPIIADQHHYFSEQFNVEQIWSIFLITQTLDVLRNRYLLINISWKKIEPDPGFHFVGKSTFWSTVFLHQQNNIWNNRYLLVSLSWEKIHPNIDDQCMNYEKVNDQTKVVRWQHKNWWALMYALIDIDGNITILYPIPWYEFRGWVEYVWEYLILPQQERKSWSISYAVIDKKGSLVWAVKSYDKVHKQFITLDGSEYNLWCIWQVLDVGFNKN
jgi:hypothetical protein